MAGGDSTKCDHSDQDRRVRFNLEGNHSRREHTGINDPQSLNTVDLQLFIHNAPIFPPRHARGGSGMVQRGHLLSHELFNLCRCGRVDTVVQRGVLVPGPIHYLACQRFGLDHPEECLDPLD